MVRGSGMLKRLRRRGERSGLPTLAILPRRKMEAILRDQVDAYRSARPFPHIVVDDMFDARLLTTIISEFPPQDGRWRTTDQATEVKRSVEDEVHMGPATRQFLHALNSSAFVSFLEQLTGIEGLLVDPHFRGGGLHQILPGGHLSVHQDFNLYPRLQVYRRLNILIYLNPDWKEEWG